MIFNVIPRLSLLCFLSTKMPNVVIVQSLLAVLKMSVAESLTFNDLLKKVFPTEASIINKDFPKRVVRISPPVYPLIFAVINHPQGKETVL